MSEQTYEEWLESRPAIVREAAIKKDPRKLYRLETTGHIVGIYSIDEPQSRQKCEIPGCNQEHGAATNNEVTFTVYVTRDHNPFLLFERKVFGIHAEDLCEVEPDTKSESF